MNIPPATTSTDPNSSAHGSATGLGDVRTLTTGDMYNYVATLLGDIDSQMLAFKEEAEKNVKRADEEREFQALLHDLTDKDGKITVTAGSEAERALAELYDSTDNDAIRDAIRGMIGNPHERLAQVALLKAQATDSDPSVALPAQRALYALTKGFDENAVSELFADSNNRLSSLSSGNELTMMELNGLMQRRSQVIMFSSQTLAQLDQAAKTVIQNMRA